MGVLDVHRRDIAGNRLNSWAESLAAAFGPAIAQISRVPHAQAVLAEMGRDDLEQWVLLAKGAKQLAFGGHVRPAQKGDAPTPTAGTVHLPTNGSIGGRNLDGSLSLLADEAGVQAPLGVGVLCHRPPQRSEVSRDNGVSRLLGSLTQLVQMGRALTLPREAGDHLVVHFRR